MQQLWRIITMSIICTVGYAEPLVMNLWPDGQFSSMTNTTPEKKFKQWNYVVANVTVPTIKVYLPEKQKSNGIAVIYCSGGSYQKVSFTSDGIGNAEYFLSKGIALIIVKYRTAPPSDNYTPAIEDGKRAVRLVRFHANEWNINPSKIGMLGGSAGGNLILNAGILPNSETVLPLDEIQKISDRPDFLVALCPWQAQQEANYFSITKNAPPLLVCTALDDKIASPVFAKKIAEAYQKAGKNIKLWTVPAGGHSAFKPGKPGQQWKNIMWTWLKDINMR